MNFINPNTNIKFCHVNWNNDYVDCLDFKTKDEQEAYFNSIASKTIFCDEYTFLKKDNRIIVNFGIEELININYLFYKNPQEDITFYCFITEKNYKNENATELLIETDVFQTWQFALNFKACFIERSHVDNDTIGLHTFPEMLESGEYIEHDHINLNFLDQKYYVVGVSESGLNTYTIPDEGRFYNGLYSGLTYLVFNDSTSISNYIKCVQKNLGGDNIYCIFVNPKSMFPEIKFTQYKENNLSFQMGILPDFIGAKTLNTYTLNKRYTTIDGYTPKNNKLFCYPYNYFFITNNAGSAVDFRYELFNSDSCDFVLNGCVTPGGDLKLIPQNYKNISSNYSEGVDVGKLPTCSWNNDSYTNWLTQNAVNIPIGVASNLGTAVGSAMVGDVGGAVGGLMGIFNQVGQIYAQSTIPQTTKGGSNQGVLNFANLEGLSIYTCSIKSEYAKIIDDFFTMFGYKINRVAVPNYKSRSNFNYIKLINAKPFGDIYPDDLQKLKNIFESGVTIWHKPTEMFDYTKNNTIL